MKPEFEDLSEDFRSGVARFISFDHYAALTEGTADVADVLVMIRQAFRTEYRALAELGYSEWVRRVGNVREKAQALVPSIADGRAHHLVRYDSKRDGSLLPHIEWADGSKGWPAPPTMPPPQERWPAVIRLKVCEYIHRFKIDPYPGTDDIGTYEFGFESHENPPSLEFAAGVPKESDPVQQAYRVAVALTREGADGRENYRLKRRREGGPALPNTLVQAVMDELQVTRTRARELLVESGFQLPRDLTYIVRKDGLPFDL